MGILPKHLGLLAKEYNDKYRFIKGDVLTLGQQSVYATLDEVRGIFKEQKSILHTLPKDFDTGNKIPSWVGTPNENRTNAQTVLTLLGAESVKVSDISLAENPDYIIDLNYKIDPGYEQKFDVIFDIGTLEHIFDISTALENITRMLRPGGRVILIVPATNAIDHGFYQFSPTLLSDFFFCNGFENFGCYLLEGNPLNYLRKGKVWKYTGFEKECPLITSHMVELYFTATKPMIPMPFKKPVQKIYTDMWKRDEGVLTLTPQQLKKEQFLKKMQGLRDKTWKLVPECIENRLTTFFINHKNLVYQGRL